MFFFTDPATLFHTAFTLSIWPHRVKHFLGSATTHIERNLCIVTGGRICVAEMPSINSVFHFSRAYCPLPYLCAVRYRDKSTSDCENEDATIHAGSYPKMVTWK